MILSMTLSWQQRAITLRSKTNSSDNSAEALLILRVKMVKRNVLIHSQCSAREDLLVKSLLILRPNDWKQSGKRAVSSLIHVRCIFVILEDRDCAVPIVDYNVDPIFVLVHDRNVFIVHRRKLG